jgi:hypothetical protein
MRFSSGSRAHDPAAHSRLPFAGQRVPTGSFFNPNATPGVASHLVTGSGGAVECPDPVCKAKLPSA